MLSLHYTEIRANGVCESSQPKREREKESEKKVDGAQSLVRWLGRS